MPGLTEQFASVEQQEQFLQCASLSGEDLTDCLPEEARIEEVIDKDLGPPDKGKGRAEGKHPNNNTPDRDDCDGPGSSNDSNDDSDDSEAYKKQCSCVTYALSFLRGPA